MIARDGCVAGDPKPAYCGVSDEECFFFLPFVLDELAVMSLEPPADEPSIAALELLVEGAAIIADGSDDGVDISLPDGVAEGEEAVGGVAEDGAAVCAIAPVEKASAAAVSRTVFMA